MIGTLNDLADLVERTTSEAIDDRGIHPQAADD